VSRLAHPIDMTVLTVWLVAHSAVVRTIGTVFLGRYFRRPGFPHFGQLSGENARSSLRSVTDATFIAQPLLNQLNTMNRCWSRVLGPSVCMQQSSVFFLLSRRARTWYCNIHTRCHVRSNHVHMKQGVLTFIQLIICVALVKRMRVCHLDWFEDRNGARCRKEH
jgi:hypothetical protein